MKFNYEMFRRWSTWLNIIECVIASCVQFLLSLPEQMSAALWAYIALRFCMGFLQGVKQSVRVKNGA